MNWLKKLFIGTESKTEKTSNSTVSKPSQSEFTDPNKEKIFEKKQDGTLHETAGNETIIDPLMDKALSKYNWVMRSMSMSRPRHMSISYSDKKDIDECIGYLDKVIELWPGIGELFGMKGDIFLIRGQINGDRHDIENAIRNYEQGLKIGALDISNHALWKSIINQLKPVIKESTFTDSRDGKTYKTVKIGNQEWMAENLAYLPDVYPSSNGSKKEPCYYVNNYQGKNVAKAKQLANYTTYGVLYNWPAAKAACPPGWHLPTDDEWKQLEIALGMTQRQADATEERGTNQGAQMKTTSGWNNNGNGTNISGFSALPGGYLKSGGNFHGVGGYGGWWSSTEDNYLIEAWTRSLSSNDSTVTRLKHTKAVGFSVRCVRY